jgi:prepilin-type N-terminal cleavage/methylation domain-containing protein
LNRGSKRAFTLIEVLVAIVLVGIAISASVGSLGRLTAAFRRSQETEVIQRLAQEKYDELVATGEWQTLSDGEFEGELYSEYTWSSETETTTVADVQYFRVTVTRTVGSREDTSYAEGLVYLPSTTSVPLEDGP